MAVACEGQLLLLVQPADGPVPEPAVLGAVPATDVLIDDAAGQASSITSTWPTLFWPRSIQTPTFGPVMFCPSSGVEPRPMGWQSSGTGFAPHGSEGLDSGWKQLWWEQDCGALGFKSFSGKVCLQTPGLATGPLQGGRQAGSAVPSEPLMQNSKPCNAWLDGILVS